MTRSLARTLAVLVLVLLAACGGIPTDSQPQAIDESLLGEELLPPIPEATRVAVQFDQIAFSIYLIGQADDGQDQLVEVRRELSVTASVQDILLDLLLGPTNAEAERNLTSAVPSDLDIIGVVGPQSGTVVIDVASGQLDRLSPEEQRLAVAQLVFTVTALNQTSSIRLQVDGVNTSLPKDGDDSSPEEPVNRLDYDSVAPDPFVTPEGVEEAPS